MGSLLSLAEHAKIILHQGCEQCVYNHKLGHFSKCDSGLIKRLSICLLAINLLSASGQTPLLPLDFVVLCCQA